MQKQTSEDFFWKVMTIIVAALFLICTAVLYKFILIKFDRPIEISVADTLDKYSEGEIKDFIILSQRFAKQHEYDIGKYNCVNYTRDLTLISKQLGFRTQAIHACPKPLSEANQTCHRFIRIQVDFEPQKGTFVDYSKEYPYQSELSFDDAVKS